MVYDPTNTSNTTSATLLTRREESVMDQRERRAALGQFLTPIPVADLMASLFKAQFRDIKLLDAGAGAGALTAAFVRRLCNAQRKPKSISVTAYGLDSVLVPHLQTTIDHCKKQCLEAGISFSASVINEDFIGSVVPVVREELFAPRLPGFNIAIANPPYCKIRSDSRARLLLRLAGIETSNFYTGFVALISKLLIKGGELVAITPRSFCNGPYFKPFRVEFLETMSLRRLHVFESRSAAFSRDNVLQENIIVRAVKDQLKPNHVVISSSNGKPGSRVKTRKVEYRDVVSSQDADQFIHLVIDDAQKKVKSIISQLPSSLLDLRLTVWTGRVVDFRAESYLRQQPANDTVPLIYPAHFDGGFVSWPKENSRKPNAILCVEKSRELLVPAGIYVLVKRFTSKEERRRVVACIYDPERIRAPLVGFENHLNYYHCQGRGLPMNLAKGLVAFLNSTILDQYFRQFNGHTQVNATDLRALKYPNKESLETLGRKMVKAEIPQKELDRLVEEELSG
jgi:adenine-specific DNA-methyltransferase